MVDDTPHRSRARLSVNLPHEPHVEARDSSAAASSAEPLRIPLLRPVPTPARLGKTKATDSEIRRTAKKIHKDFIAGKPEVFGEPAIFDILAYCLKHRIIIAYQGASRYSAAYGPGVDVAIDGDDRLVLLPAGPMAHGGIAPAVALRLGLLHLNLPPRRPTSTLYRRTDIRADIAEEVYRQAAVFARGLLVPSFVKDAYKVVESDPQLRKSFAAMRGFDENYMNSRAKAYLHPAA